MKVILVVLGILIGFAMIDIPWRVTIFHWDEEKKKPTKSGYMLIALDAILVIAAIVAGIFLHNRVNL